MEQKCSVAKWAGESKDAFIEKCINSFGLMNKSHYEVELFRLLMENEFKNNETDFEISLRLQIPESKVKRLRYEMQLRYYQDDTLKQLDNAFFNLIKKNDFKLTAERIQFCINDKMLRAYLSYKLSKENRFADSSFNSNVVSITADDFKCLLKDSEFTDDEKKDIITKTKEKIINSTKELPKTMKERLVAIAGNVMKIVGGCALETVINESIELLKKEYTVEVK